MSTSVCEVYSGIALKMQITVLHCIMQLHCTVSDCCASHSTVAANQLLQYLLYLCSTYHSIQVVAQHAVETYCMQH